MARKFQTAGQGSVHALVALLLDGQPILVRGGADGAVRLIDVRGSATRRSIEAHRGPARALAVVPRNVGDPGAPLVATGGVDGVVRLWEPHTGEKLAEQMLGGEVSALSCLPLEGRTVVAANGTDGGVHLWDPHSGEVIRRFGVTRSPVWTLTTVVTGEGAVVAAGGADGTVRLWDPTTGRAVETITGAHRSTIWAMVGVQTPDGVLLATGGADAAVRLWDPLTGTRVREFGGHSSTIRTLAVLSTENGDRLASGSADSTIRLWHPTGTSDLPEHTFLDNAGEVWALCPVDMGDHALLAGGGAEGTVWLFDASTRQRSSLLAGSSNTVWALSSVDLGDRTLLASGGVEGAITLTELETGTVERTLHGHQSTVRALTTVEGDGRPLIASGGADGSVRLWDVRAGAETKRLRRGHVGEVWSLASFADGERRYVASGGADGKVRLWRVDATDDDEPVILGDHQGEVFALAVVRTGDTVLVASGGAHSRVYLWDAGGGGERGRFETTGGTVWALTAFPDGPDARLTCGLANGTVAVCDGRTGVPLGQFSAPGSAVRALATVRDKDEVLIVGGCHDGAIRVWHSARRDLVFESPRHTGTVRALAVATLQGAPQLISGGDDGDVRRHDLGDRRYEGKIRISARPATRITSDRPSTVDACGRDVIVDALYDFLTDRSTTPPVVVAVQGPWGHGKSSVLLQLRDRLDPAQGDVGGPGITHRLRWADPDRSMPPPGRLRRVGRAIKRLLLPRRGRYRRLLSPSWAAKRLRRYQSARHHHLLAELVPVGDAPSGADSRLTVWFNPWTYHNRDELWAGLAQEIIKAITGRLPTEDRARLWFELNLRRSDPVEMRKRLLLSYLPRTPFGIITTLLLTASSVVAFWIEGNAVLNDARYAVLFAVLPALAVLLKLVWTALRGSVADVLPPAMFSGPAAGGLARVPGAAGPDSPVDPLHESRAGYLYLLQHDIGQIVGMATADRPIVVFIDDLDRCSSDMIGDTVEAINLFVNNTFGQCNFVIALDPVTIAAHLETTQEALMRRILGEPLAYGALCDVGWRFMEKFTDLPVRLPRLTDDNVGSYARALLAAPDATPPGAARLMVPDPPLLTGGPPRVPAPRDPLDRERAESVTQAPPSGAARRQPARPVLDIMSAVDRFSAADDAVRLDDDPTRAVAHVEAMPEVSEALRRTMLALPRRSPREIKRFVNLWRFYLSLEHRQGLLLDDTAEMVRHARTLAQFVELLLRWPKYLGVLSSGVHGVGLLCQLVTVAGDTPGWRDALAAGGLDPEDAQLEELRWFLAPVDETLFAEIAERYL